MMINNPVRDTVAQSCSRPVQTSLIDADRGLLTKLYRYKAVSERSPFEDFLTEAFCHFLNLVDAAGFTDEALEYLLGISGWTSCHLKWRAQYRVPSTASNAAGRRPDLVGEGRCGEEHAFVIIENKTGAGYTASVQEDGTTLVSQLDMYRGFLNEHSAQHKAIRLLRHGTPKPEAWPKEETVDWHDVCENMRAWLSKPAWDSAPIAADFGIHICEFLEENNMSEIKLEIDDIASYSRWKRLRQQISELGTVWPYLESQGTPTLFDKGGFGVTHGAAYGGFHWRERRFVGSILTPKEEGGAPAAAANSNVHFYIGVLLDTVYDVIHPEVKDVPEFTCGFAFWHPDDYDEKERSAMDEIYNKLHEYRNSWKFDIRKDEHGWDVTVIYNSSTFLSIYTPETNWREEAKAFYEGALRDLNGVSYQDLKILSKLNR